MATPFFTTERPQQSIPAKRTGRRDVEFSGGYDRKDNNIHAFEIVNTDWVPENIVLRRPRISKAARMATQCFLERGIPFQYNPITGIPEGVNSAKMTCVDQRFGLGYKPSKEDHRWAASRRRERRIARIEGREPEEEKLEIPPLSVSFPKAAYTIITQFWVIPQNSFFSQKNKK